MCTSLAKEEEDRVLSITVTFRTLTLNLMWFGKRNKVIEMVKGKGPLGNNLHSFLITKTTVKEVNIIPAAAAAAAAKSLQSCPTLCNPIDGSPPGSPVPGILQARTLEWVAISFSNA